jgi:hypothetical protein
MDMMKTKTRQQNRAEHNEQRAGQGNGFRKRGFAIVAALLIATIDLHLRTRQIVAALLWLPRF